ncbi:MAG: outer membrane protein assembly factor BamA [Xanthobacteraceae bacterium]
MYRRGFRIAAVLVALLAALALAGGRTAAAQSASSIVVKGNKAIGADAIRAYFSREPGELDAVKIDKALKALYASGHFEDVRIARVDGQLTVTVVENRTLDKVAFEGNRKVKDDELKALVQSKARGPLSRATVQQDVVRILEAYRHGGRFDVRVEPKIIERAENRADLVFEIREGQKIGIKEVAFVGNQAFSSNRLTGEIKTGQTNLLSFLLNNDVYDADRVEGDRDLLRLFYLKHGYADVRIVAGEGRYDEAKNGFVVTFTIDEGERYRVGMVDLRSAVPELDAGALRARLHVAPADVYNGEAVDKSIADMTLEAARRGHPFVQIRREIDRAAASRTINLAFVVEPGPRTFVERIELRGNTHTRDYVIRREFDIAEGDAYNKALIDRAERRLKNLGYFKSVKIHTEAGSAADRVILDVDLEEQETGQFSVAGGYSTTDGVVAQVSIGDRNLNGGGEQAKASVTLGQYAQGVDLAFVEPYVLGTHMSAAFDVFGKQTTASPYQSYGNESYGASVAVGTPLTDNLSSQTRYSIAYQGISLAPGMIGCSPSNLTTCGANAPVSAAVQQAALNGPSWVSSVGDTVAWNTLDNNKNPTSGVNASLSQDVAGLGGDVKFMKTTSDVRLYQPVTDDVVGMARMQGGYISPLGGQPLPLMNGFFGGPQLVRGFAPNGFGPRDLTPGTTMDNVGGSQYWASSMQVTAPLPFVPPQSGLKVATFADAGSLWGYRGQTSFPALGQSIQLADSSSIRSSLGASMIWDSPFGALHVDYAYPVSKTSYDATQRFRFGAGAF